MSEHRKGRTFEELYLEQRKKSQMLLVAVVVLAIATAGSLAWGFSKSGGTSRPDMANGGFSQGMNGQGGPGGMRGMMDIKSFFKDDGSVDTEKVKEITSRMPSGGKNSGFNIVDRFKEQTTQAVTDGDITQDQADSLIKAFESESTTNES